MIDSPCQVFGPLDRPGRGSMAPYRKRDAERVVDGYQVLNTGTRPSTQVYTPFGRWAGDTEFFRFFLKSEAIKSARSFL
jgi:hypothetical protein